MVEIFKDIKGFEGYYKVSNFGNVISLERIIFDKNGRSIKNNEKFMTLCNKKGYKRVSLYKECVRLSKYVHCILWEAFVGEIGYPDKMIDHIDGNRANNRIDNLRIVNARTNCHNKKNNSEFIGVRKEYNKYRATIKIKSQAYNLGSFNSPEEAHSHYKEAVLHLETDFHEWHKNLNIKTISK